ncbi:hypothetical protein VNO77_42104 [Canavalia gladiata]|uniref:Pectinesterase inhibitor domain-containing protein n=1 Tax=Canavalia gladiata TaxID=3824 RepID=A0AAN9PS45_CANGL
MNPSTQLSLLFTLSLILISHAGRLPASSPASASTKLYQTVCKDAVKVNDGTDRCLKLLEADPKITSAKNFVELCSLVLKLAIDRSTKAQDYFIQESKKNPSSEAIKGCATNHYKNTVTSFSSALKELAESPDTANYDAKVAGDGPVNCNQALTNEKVSSLLFFSNFFLFLSFSHPLVHSWLLSFFNSLIAAIVFPYSELRGWVSISDQEIAFSP